MEEEKETDREENVMREQQQGLYSPAFEHDNCGIGAVVNSKGIKSHLTVERALHIVENRNTEPEKMQRRRQETAWESFFRFRINSFPMSVKHWGSIWEGSEY